jgi:hypothetical protein
MVEQEQVPVQTKTQTTYYRQAASGGGVVYGIGLIGALIYFIQHATSFMDGLVGVLYAIFWPGVLVYRAFEILGM